MFPVCTLVRRRWRGRKRWPGQDAGGTPALPGVSDHSSPEGKSQKPSRQAKTDAVEEQEPGRQAVAAATPGRIRTVLID
jgi:hypothetical protein